MENGRETARRGLQALLRLGADKAQCMVSLVEKHEMNVDAGSSAYSERPSIHRWDSPR